MRYLLSLTLFLTITTSSFADLIWDREKGWYAEGGLAELFFPREDDSKNAVEAMNKAKLAQEAGDFREASSLYKYVYKNYELSIFAPEALLQMGKILRARNRIEGAFEKYQTIVKEYPNYDKFNQVIEAQYQLAQDLQNGARLRLFWGVFPGFRSLETAVEYYETVVRNARYSDYAAPALMNIAEISIKRNNTDEAIYALDRLISNYPQNILNDKAYYKIARTYQDIVQGSSYDQESTTAAMNYFEDYLALFPDAPQVADAERGLQETKNTLAKSKYDIGEYYYVIKRNDRAAKIFFNETITTAPNSDFAQKAKARIERIEAGEKRPAPPGAYLLRNYGLPKPPRFDNKDEGDTKIEEIGSGEISPEG